MRKKLCISFSDEEEINEIIKDDMYKINTRSVLGVKNNNDWIYGLNIGNIMHLTPFTFDEVYNDINKYDEDSIINELKNNSVLEKLILLASTYFCIATELRFLNKKVSESVYPKKLSEMWHAKSVHTCSCFLPKESPLAMHIHSSYIKHHLKDKVEEKKKFKEEQARRAKLEAKRKEKEQLELERKRQEEYKQRVINELVNEQSRNLSMKCKALFLLILFR